MSVLRNLESKLAGLVEGTFSRAFKSEVRPVEIARKLAREMDEHRVQSLSRTYVPNEYTVWLSPDDREQFSGYEDELRRELSGYLLEHARKERVALLTPPEIGFKTDDRLRLGEFGIQARLVRPHEDPASRAAPGGGGPHDGLLVVGADRGAAARAGPAPRRARGCGSAAAPSCSAPAGAVLGRSREADIVLDDANVSRKHAEVRPSGGSWTVRDLGSTNGVKVNGRRIDGRPVAQAGRRDRARHLPRDLRAGVGPPMLDPVAVALKFGFLAVLYLFLLWMARSALQRPAPHLGATAAASAATTTRPGCTPRGGGRARRAAAPKLRVGDGRRAASRARPTT